MYLNVWNIAALLIFKFSLRCGVLDATTTSP